MERSDDVLIGGQSMNTNGNSFVNSMQNGDLNSINISNNSNSNSGNANGSGLTTSGTNTNGNTNNNNNSSGNNTGNERPANVYTMPGILHYMQHEWNRFEFERQQWDIERSELMVKTAHFNVIQQKLFKQKKRAYKLFKRILSLKR